MTRHARLSSPIIALSFIALASSCATTRQSCDDQMSACLERCQESQPASGKDSALALRPQARMTECERHCACRPLGTHPSDSRER